MIDGVRKVWANLFREENNTQNFYDKKIIIAKWLNRFLLYKIISQPIPARLSPNL